MGKSKPQGGGKSGDDYEDARERIFQALFDEYHDSKDGLIKMAGEAERAFRTLGEPKKVVVQKPKKKVNVVLVGNHSAGKSSFINWYVGEELMKSGVAIETKNITFVVYGKRRETFKGPASLRLLPHLQDLTKISNTEHHLVTEVSASRSRQFGAVCLIDTPGLVDGAFQYPFEVNDALVWLATHAADVVFVLLDPQGQALCARTMNVIEAMDRVCSDKMHYFLSKSDTVANEDDRQKVLIQVTQGLSQRIQNKNFDIIPMYVPIKGVNDDAKVPNRIEEACKLTDRAINATLQTSLHRMEVDAETLTRDIDEILVQATAATSANRKALVGSAAFMSLTLVPIAMLLALGVSLGRPMFTWLPDQVLSQVDKLSIPDEWRASFAGVNLAVILVVWLYAKFAFRVRPSLTSAEVARFRKCRARLESRTKRVAKELYDEYFKTTVADNYEEQ